MRVQADLRCYHCGYVAARVEGDEDQPFAPMRLVLSTVGPGARLRPPELPRCGRCGGPLYQDAFESFQSEPAVFDPLPEVRRGRPPMRGHALLPSRGLVEQPARQRVGNHFR